MSQAKLLTFTLVLFGIQQIVVSDSGDHFLRRDQPMTEVHGFPHGQVPKGFGYSVQNGDQQASHFRKEHRDINGVVRGSYGLKDPDGTFRLVRYIADDKGFRAHITSNEPGVGHQSPASVSVSRFSRSQPASKEAIPPELTSFETRNNKNYPGIQDWSSNYNFYNPSKQDLNNQGESSEDFEPLDLKKYLSNHQFFDDTSVPEQDTPSSTVMWKDYNGNVYPNHDQSDIGIVNSGGTASNYDKKDKYGDDWSSGMGASKDHLINDYFKYTKGTQKINSFPDNSERIPSDILSILLSHPQQKVHTNLPDCGTVNSAVLCKPPPFSNNYMHHNTTENRYDLPLDTRRTDAIRMLKPGEIKEHIETTLTDRLYRFSADNDDTVPSHTLPDDFSSHSAVFNSFPGMKHLSEKVSPCSDKHGHTRGNTAEDLTLTSALNRPVIYNTISNTHISSYGENWRNQPTNNVVQNNPHHFHRLSSASNDDIEKIVLNNNNKLILLTPQSTPGKIDNSAFNLLERLNVLGFLIFPNDYDRSQKGLIKDTEPATATDQRTVYSNMRTGYRNEQQNPGANQDEPSQHVPETRLRLNTELSNSRTTTDHVLKNPSGQIENNFPKVGSSVLNKEIRNLPLGGEPVIALQPNNSEFLILDDAYRQDGSNGSKDRNETMDHPPNWRKVFEDEITEEHRTISIQKQTNTTDDISRSSGIPNERVYQLHDPPSPLYDSRGAPVKSENVPLHLHRYVPPTGITSYPWKFAIPRPVPPRSVVVPPKPPALS